MRNEPRIPERRAGDINPMMVTRMDIVDAPEIGLIVKVWHGEWTPGSAPDGESYRMGVSLDQAAAACERAGYTVRYYTADGAHQAQCLRGPITRMDFRLVAGQVKIQRWPYGWCASTRPISEDSIPEGEFENTLNELRNAGWTVHTWRGGARAWRGDPLPVRDAGVIRRMRDQAKTDLMNGHITGAYNMDLAYDF